MIKDFFDQNGTISANDREINILKEHFPSCFSKDGSFDLERFKEYIGDKVDVKSEGYELKFLGKNYARLLVSLNTTTVIKPDETHNEKLENRDSENIYITGDNLDGLKHLLKSYAGKIKCIYIDPPYNTGSDGFIYSDRFEFTIDDLMTRLNISESQAQRTLDLAKRGAASHSAWLMFMYPRLQLARDLLADDGVIFISIDNHEQANLKLLCDDIFYEENFVDCITWNTRIPKNDNKGIGNIHQYVLVYVRNNDVDRQFLMSKDGLEDVYELLNKLKDLQTPIPEAEEELKRLYRRKDYDRGITLYNALSDDYRAWGKINMSWPNSDTFGPTYDILHPVTNKPTKKPDRGWRWNKETLDSRLDYKNLIRRHDGSYVCGDIWFANDENTQPSSITFLDEVENMLLRSVISLKSDGGIELERLFNEKSMFSNPKPTSLISMLIESLNDKDGIYLDFFSGSATTAHSVMLLNEKDGGNRKYILIQLPEDLDSPSTKLDSKEKKRLEKVTAFLDSVNRPHTLDQIGIERIIRAAEKIREDNPNTIVDLGFKHFLLEEPTGKQLDDIIGFDCRLNQFVVSNNLVEEFGTATVLTTWLVRDGYGFSPDVRLIEFGAYTGYYIDKHLYLLDKGLDHAVIEAIVEAFDTDPAFNPENVVLFGYSFTWTQMESLETNLKRLKATEKNLRINFDVRY